MNSCVNISPLRVSRTWWSVASLIFLPSLSISSPRHTERFLLHFFLPRSVRDAYNTDALAFSKAEVTRDQARMLLAQFCTEPLLFVFLYFIIASILVAFR